MHIFKSLLIFLLKRADEEKDSGTDLLL